MNENDTLASREPRLNTPLGLPEEYRFGLVG
jgi:hypothetical protein